MGRTQQYNMTTGETTFFDEPDPVIPLDAAKARKVARLQARAHQAQDIGIIVDGLPVRTDAATRNDMSSLESAYGAGHADTIRHRFPDGVWRPVTRAGNQAILRAVAQHLKNCKDVEYTKETAILALGTVEEVLAYDIETGWPT